MTFSRKVTTRLSVLLMATVCALALSACSGQDEQLTRDLAAPERVDVLAPPKSPDPSMMDPALQIARSRGLKTNVYFNEELQQAVARLQGMEETLGRLQSDLQGTAMAMQRVEMMRKEVEGLNLKIQSLQERLMYAGPALAPAPMPMMQAETIAPDVSSASPMPLMGDMAQAVDAGDKGQISKPVMDEAPVKAAANTGSGVVGVRVGAHSGKVRVVLDVNGSKYNFSSSVDNKEKLLTVELPDTVWSAAKSQKIGGNPLVVSYTAQSADKGTVVAFVLKGDTKILEMKTLKGTGGAPTRLLIDLAN